MLTGKRILKSNCRKRELWNSIVLILILSRILKWYLFSLLKKASFDDLTMDLRFFYL